jgi:hypothetical protein
MEKINKKLCFIEHLKINVNYQNLRLYMVICPHCEKEYDKDEIIIEKNK